MENNDDEDKKTERMSILKLRVLLDSRLQQMGKVAYFIIKNKEVKSSKNNANIIKDYKRPHVLLGISAFL